MFAKRSKKHQNFLFFIFLFYFHTSFKLKRTLDAHVKYKHSGTRSYVCEFCAKILSTKQNFNQHIKAHTQMPPFECTICGALLKKRTYLDIHMRIHTDKEQTCDICFQVKKNPTALRAHKRYVHGAATHKCRLCDKAFTRLAALRVS